MFSDTFVTVFFTGMVLIGILGLILARCANKETARIQKEISDRALAHKNIA